MILDSLKVRKLLNEAQTIINTNVLKWESTLQRNLNTVDSITRVDNTTVSFRLNREVTSIQASECV